MVKLSKRLQFVAQEIGTVDTIADIGTDHGKLIIYALEHGFAKRAFAVDISEKSLEKARRNIEEEGLGDRVVFFCGDGLNPLKIMPDVVVIAGMGGHETVKILSAGKRAEKLVLVPHQDAHVVRKYLAESGYDMEKDYVVEDGKYYAVIVATPGKCQYTEEEILLGKNNPKREDFGNRIKSRVAAIDRIKEEQNIGIDGLKEEIKKEYEVMTAWLRYGK